MNRFNLLQESRFSNGTSRSTRQGASFLILMFKINPGCRLSRPCDLTAPFDTELNETDNPRAARAHQSGARAEMYIIFCRRSPLRLLERKALTATVSRLAGDCELNGMREFTWGPVRGWVTARHANWPAVAVAAVTLVNRGRSFPNVRDVTASAYDDSLRVPCRHDAASFFHTSIYRVTSQYYGVRILPLDRVAFNVSNFAKARFRSKIFHQEKNYKLVNFRWNSFKIFEIPILSISQTFEF